MKTTTRVIRPAFLASLLLVLSGCVAAIGNREPARSSATLGQQLVDLKKAYEAGAITQTEYETQRAKFLQEK